MSNKTTVPSLRFRGFGEPWEEKNAAILADYSKGNGYSKSDLTKTGTPIILYGRLYTKYEFVINDVDTFTIPKRGSVYSQGNEVIIPASGETAEDIARAAAIEKPGILLGGDLNILRPFDFINPLFLALAISNGKPQKDLIKKAQGKSVVHIHNSDIQGIILTYPSKIEQNRIVEVFRNLDRLIALEQRKYDKLNTVKKSMLEKMFPQKGAKVPEIRFKGFSEPWEEKKFEDLANRSSLIGFEDNLPRIEYEDIISGTGQLNKNIFAKKSRKSGILFHKDDVLYGKLRPYLKNWFLASFDGIAVGDFWVLQTKNIDSSFLYRLVQCRQFNDVANQSIGTKMPRADWKLISKTMFFVPTSLSEQTKIGSYFQNLDRLITSQGRKIEKLRNLKKACLEKMFV
ncbi:MAG: restriction endonuclease subunit S [Spirochaetia bacterium]|nr:restriction endonuclease subunit S [Spirochaetia bacterium]